MDTAAPSLSLFIPFSFSQCFPFVLPLLNTPLLLEPTLTAPLTGKGPIYALEWS
jgi:hypothetical protein